MSFIEVQSVKEVLNIFVKKVLQSKEVLFMFYYLCPTMYKKIALKKGDNMHILKSGKMYKKINKK